MTVDIKKIKGEIYDSKNSLGDSLNTLAKKTTVVADSLNIKDRLPGCS